MTYNNLFIWASGAKIIFQIYASATNPSEVEETLLPGEFEQNFSIIEILNTPSGIVITKIGMDAFSLVGEPNISAEIGIHLSVITTWDLRKQVSISKPSSTLHRSGPLLLSQNFSLSQKRNVNINERPKISININKIVLKD